MENGLFETEVTFWGKHVAETLGIAAVTLRKWSLELEKQGWEFSKDDQQRRAYTQRDYIALRYLNDLMRDRRMSLEKAAIQVVKRHGNDPMTTDIAPYRSPDIGEHAQENALVAQAETARQINELTLAVQQLTEQVELIVQEQVRQELAAAREKIASEIQSIGQQMSTQNEDLREQLELMINETRAERHRKKGFWARLFGQ